MEVTNPRVAQREWMRTNYSPCTELVEKKIKNSKKVLGMLN